MKFVVMSYREELLFENSDRAFAVHQLISGISSSSSSSRTLMLIL